LDAFAGATTMKKRKDKLEVWRRFGSKYLSSALQITPVWHWHLRNAYNGKIVTSGEPNGYTSKAKALKGWKSVVKAAGGAGMGNVEVVEP
jgi:uncharacterized protein YegP (UPF0339 family)